MLDFPGALSHKILNYLVVQYSLRADKSLQLLSTLN